MMGKSDVGISKKDAQKLIFKWSNEAWRGKLPLKARAALVGCAEDLSRLIDEPYLWGEVAPPKPVQEREDEK